MLTKLRDIGKTWIFKVFMGLLVVSFALWGIADIFSGFRSNSVATVGDADVTIEAFRRSYTLELRALQRQFGGQVTETQARALGVPDRVLGQLIAEAAMQAEADALRLGISDEMLIELIASDPTFQSNGRFDRARFVSLLRSNNMSEAGYVAAQRALEIRRQVAAAVNGGLMLPAAYTDALHAYRTEERSIQYLIISPAQAGEIGSPGESEVAAFYEAHKAEWRAPEYRALMLVSLTPADLAKAEDVSEEDIRKRYESNKASYGSPETRRVRQIVFRDQADAEAALARIKGGETFDALMASRNLTGSDVDLGVVTKEKIIDPAIADAAFSLAPNQTSAVVTGRFGPTILSVTDVTAATLKSLDEVRDQIRSEIATRLAAADVATMRDTVEDARAGGETLSEIGAKHKLTVRPIAAVDQRGNGPDGQPITDMPGGTALLAAAFESDIGIENESLPIENNGVLWYEVTDVTASRDLPLAEVRDKVVEGWKKEAVAKKLEERATSLADRVRGGTSFDSIGDELALTVETARGLKRDTEPAGSLSAAMLIAAFSGPDGSVTVTTGKDDPSRAVLKVVSVSTPADGAADAEAVAAVRRAFADDLFQQYITALQAQLGVRINQTTLQQSLGTLGS